jgi:arylsulfatase A-like enzyme
MSRLNILMLTTDEERYRLPQPEGFHLPARERLIERGVSFERYYAAATQCSSSRSVIYTGRHLPITQIYDNDNMPYIRPLDPQLGTIGTMLRAAGYYTTYQGKWHLSNAYVDPANPRSTVDDLEPYGFSEWNDWGDIDGGAWAGLRVDPVIAGQAAKWLRDRAPQVSPDQPWFMAVNFVNPHDIMSFDYGGRAEIQLPPVLAHAVATKPAARVPLYERRFDVDLPSSSGDDLEGAPSAVREFRRIQDEAFGHVPGDEQWVEGLNFYLNCIRDVDRHVGVVLDALTASGQADRTIVMFTADHGDMAGSHGLRQKGNLVYDENFHVPLVIVHPDLAAGSTSALASAVDLVPTILAMAGVTEATLPEAAPRLPGHSLLPALEGGEVRNAVLTCVEGVTNLDADFWGEFSSSDTPARIASGELRPDWRKRGFLRGLTDARYTFGRYFSPLEPNRPGSLEQLFDRNDVVLYDREHDPGELHNLANDASSAALVDGCLRRLEALITDEVGDDGEVWVAERPQLLGWPTWMGDRPAERVAGATATL